MNLHESGENYLETILLLQRKQGYVRATDVAEAMHFTKASVSRAVKLLRESGYLELDAHRMLILTEQGRQRATQIYERHQLFQAFLTEILHVDPQIAQQDACRLEHVVSDSTVQGLKALYEKLK